MKRITERQLILTVFCFGVVLGTLLANLFPKLYLPAVTQMIEELGQLLKGDMTVHTDYFRYLLSVRLIPVVLIGICLLTPCGGEGLCVSALWYGICCGAVLSGSVLLYGMSGLVLFFAAVFPQYLFYILIFMQMIIRYEMDRRGGYGQPSGMAREFRFWLVITVLFLAGVLLETYLNPLILRFAFLMV